MKNVIVIRVGINPDRLKEELDSLQIAGFDGFAHRGDKLELVCQDQVSDFDIGRLSARVAAHDPSVQSTNEKKRDSGQKEVKRLQKKYPDAVDPATVPPESALAILLERVRLLELKLAQLTD